MHNDLVDDPNPIITVRCYACKLSIVNARGVRTEDEFGPGFHVTRYSDGFNTIMVCETPENDGPVAVCTPCFHAPAGKALLEGDR